MQAELWSLNGLAVELGCDRRTLARDLEGLSPDEETRKGGRIERRYRMRRVFQHLASARLAATGAEDFDNQRERLAAAQAEKFEMENSVRRSQLAEVSKVQAAWSDHIAAARAKLLSMPSKLGPQLTNVTDPNVVSARIRAEVYAAINELAEWELPEADGGDIPSDAPGTGDVEKSAAPNSKPVGRRKSKTEQRIVG